VRRKKAGRPRNPDEPGRGDLQFRALDCWWWWMKLIIQRVTMKAAYRPPNRRIVELSILGILIIYVVILKGIGKI